MASGEDEKKLMRLRGRPSDKVSSRQKQAQYQRHCNNSTDMAGDSRLLVWPRRSRNLERPGYVLGWKSSRSTPLTCNRGNHDTRSTITTTVVCAGVLPMSKPLAEYCQVLERLKNKHRHQQEEESNKTQPQCGDKEPSDKDLGCYTASLVASLDIVAIWDPTDGNISKSKSTQASGKQQLPRITTSRRYPWWATEEEDQKEPSSRGDDRITTNPHQQRRQQQLLYYDLDTRQGQFGHFAVESMTLTNSTQWSRMLVKLNHASTICDIVESGAVNSVSSPLKPTQATASAMDGDFSKKRESETRKDGHDATSGPPLVAWKWLQHKLFIQSFMMLHFRKLCRRNKRREDGTSAEGKVPYDAWSLMSCFSLFRLLRLLRQRPPHLDRGTRGVNTIFMDSAKVGDSVLPSPSAEAQLHVMYWNQVLMASVDMILGLVVAWIILSWYHEDLQATSPPALYLNTKLALWRTLHHNIAWLQSFPGGFKLNVPLTENMGHEIRNLIQIHQLALSTTLGNLDFLKSYLFSCLAVVGALFGWSSLLALVVDVWKLEILHITILAACFRALYRSELYLLAALFRLFRGKKRNVLRHRTDSMEYDVMQLLVGTLCFCICIFLWTTILVYYTFFVCWNAILQIPIIAIWMIYVTTYQGATPWGTLFWWRNRNPDWFARTVHVKELLDDGSVTVLRLVSVPESHGSLLSKSIHPHSRRFLAWFISFGLEVFFPGASTLSPHSMPLESLLSQD
jgi:hypothetical protein